MASLTLWLAGLTGLAAYLYGPATHTHLTKLGVFRTLNASSPSSLHPNDAASFVHLIQDTVHCEDLHYYEPGNVLFTACEDVNTTRYEWFPALSQENCVDPAQAVLKQGSIHVIDPETRKSTRLAFENFNDPFITHGIDVIPDSSSSSSPAVFIVAVNHIPGSPSSTEKCPLASRIDVFSHTLGTSTARFLHTITHPLIRTPNDVYAVSENEVYVTNDRWYAEGLMRTVETMWPGARWSDVVHATRVPAAAAGKNDRQGEEQFVVEASIAVDKLQNPNGIGHGRTADEIMVASAVGGRVWLGSFSASSSTTSSSSSSASSNQKHTPTTIQINGTIEVPSTIDNPSWYQDPYPSSSSSSDDASGFILAGLKRAVNLGSTAADPHGREGVMVWYVKPGPHPHTPASQWESRLLWEDDGGLIRNAATAVLVGIDPAKETAAGGGKRAWLFVTGFSSENAVAVKVDL